MPFTKVGWAVKASGATLSVCATELPHVPFAATLIVPAMELIVEILLVIEVPVQPVGIVQLYDMAPLTGGMLYCRASPGQ